MVEGDVHIAKNPSIIGEYRLIEQIGRGAMGRIFLARDTLLERDVALKLMATEKLVGDARASFLREARALARVSHPNVVAVHRVGEFEGDTYLVTELVQGRSLEDLPKPVPWQTAVNVGIGIARGLAAAHRKQVLHRDIKPANVMMSVEGEVKVVDFGLAKLVGDTDIALRAADEPARANARWSRVSRSGDFVGTPLYMAPEVFHGKAATVQSDVYGIAALLYELVVGVPHRDLLPEDVSVSEWIEAVPEPLHEMPNMAIDVRFSRIVGRCLARDPTERFSTAEALAEALEALHDDKDSGEVPSGNPYRGLEPFEMEHRGMFFGRDAEIRAVQHRFRDESFVVVAGDSGVGKSSLCKAGVLPLMSRTTHEQGRSLRIIRLVPSHDPLRALQHAFSTSLSATFPDLSTLLDADHAALYREISHELEPDEDLLIFVDQLEELCTLSALKDAELFAEALIRACVGSHVDILATLRGDFITHIAAIGAFGPVLTKALYLLRPMIEEGIRAAIVKPALLKGVAFESEELVDDLVRASAQMPGGWQRGTWANSSS